MSFPATKAGRHLTSISDGGILPLEGANLGIGILSVPCLVFSKKGHQNVGKCGEILWEDVALYKQKHTLIGRNDWNDDRGILPSFGETNPMIGMDGLNQFDGCLFWQRSFSQECLSHKIFVNRFVTRKCRSLVPHFSLFSHKPLARLSL